MITNYLRKTEEEVVQQLVDSRILDKPSFNRVGCDNEAVVRCFSADSVEEIMRRLKAE